MMSIQELEDFFHTHPVPEGTKLNAATVLADPDKFLSVNFDVIRQWPRDLNKCPSYWHLCQLATIMAGNGNSEGI
ncbi:DUF6965 family protein [Parapedobacter sp.]